MEPVSVATTEPSAWLCYKGGLRYTSKSLRLLRFQVPDLFVRHSSFAYACLVVLCQSLLQEVYSTSLFVGVRSEDFLDNCANSALAALRSAVSNPSVNQP